MGKKQKVVPFETRAEASYWGGTGVIAEDRTGGWWALGFVSTPSGIEAYCVGKSAEPIPGGPWRCVVDGFPDTLLHRHFVGRDWEAGSGYQIYRKVES